MDAAPGSQITARASKSEGRVNPDILDKTSGVKNTLSPELRTFLSDVEAATRDGWLTGEVVQTLSRVLRLAAPFAKKQPRVHTEHHVLAEGTEGQVNERGKKAHR